MKLKPQKSSSFYLREFEMFFMSYVYEEQMCFEEIHSHDLYFDEKKIETKILHVCKKRE